MQRKNSHQKLSQTIGCRRETFVKHSHASLLGQLDSRRGSCLRHSGMRNFKLGISTLQGLHPPVAPNSRAHAPQSEFKAHLGIRGSLLAHDFPVAT